MKGKRGWGAQAENYAANLLIKKGYKILEKNFSCAIGEIDIITQDNDTLVFVEVKARSSTKFGLPAEAVTPRKLQKIKRVGDYYSLLHPLAPKKKRIDVVAIEVKNGCVSTCSLIKVV